ncbi:MAG TPA: hypothetical protein PKC49_12435 [Phycisphaerae bacterium]|nr:hypothetical protein [Phycisphaerae bacterium]
MRACVTLALLGAAILALGLGGQRGPDSPGPRPTELQGPIEKLSPFLGTWEIEATWSSGEKLWARNEYRVGVGGRFLEATTFARDGDGKVYERYLTIFCYDAAKKAFVSHGFTFDGTAKVTPVDVGEEAGRPIVSLQWKIGEGDAAPEFRQRVAFVDGDSYRWQVWTRSGGAEDWSPMMDGVWKRVRR